MPDKVSYKGREIPYLLTRKPVKNINLRVKPDGIVYLSANSRVPLKTVEAFIQAKGDFILRAFDYWRNLEEKSPSLLETGETVWVLGVPCTLGICESTKDYAVQQDNLLKLYLRHPQEIADRQKLLERFYSDLCRQTILQLNERVYPAFSALGIAHPTMKFRRMKSRWGSCQPQKGILTFHTGLAQKSLDCMEYVLLHEYAHFVHPNHSKQFYALVESLLPDYRERRIRLNRDYSK